MASSIGLLCRRAEGREWRAAERIARAAGCGKVIKKQGDVVGMGSREGNSRGLKRPARSEKENRGRFR